MTQLLSLILVIFSAIFYSIVTFPQLFINCRNKTTKGIDTIFIVTWIFADYFTLISVIRKDLPITTVSMCIFHILCTILLIIQKVYYSKSQSFNRKIGIVTLIIVSITCILTFFVFSYHTILFADIAGWISCILYIVSPIPQLVYNYRRKSVDGLSSLLFIFLIIGNSLFIASIFVISTEFSYIYTTFQIIITDIVCNVLYIIICIQFVIYDKNPEGHTWDDEINLELG
jgi:uncharacterized protein with PQ loop repeat